MRKKIFQAMMAAASAVLLASLIIILGCLYDYFGGLQEKQMQDELTLASAGLEQSGKVYLTEQHLESKRFRLTWIDAQGNVLYDTKADGSSMENHADREEFQQAIKNGFGESSRYSSTLMEKTLYRAQRLADGSVLRISVSRATSGVLLLGMLQPIVLVLIVALALSALLSKRIARWVVAPLENLDLEHPLENDTYEELAPLLGRINQQRRQIDLQLAGLQRRNDEFAQITGSMKEGLILLNEKNQILSINPMAQRLFETDESCVGEDFLAVERSPEVNAAIAEAFAKGSSKIQLPRGERTYQLDISAISSGGAVIGAVILVFDITESMRAEQSRREFTANVSHELKTPLQSIMGSAELIENGLVAEDDMPRFVGHIRTEAARLVTLIEDIIRLSQLDEGSELPFEVCDLTEIAREVTESLADAADQRKISLTFSGEPFGLCSVKRLLAEICYNLCDNAIKYNREGGHVMVSTGRAGDEAVLTVRDTGIGIPPEHQERIFERFYRVDKSHSKESGGTGLGLSIVKHAVQDLGGRIELDSTPGEGTEIKVYLPLKSAV
ncbi:MAG: ATP-binding protein [Clostridia bacterium]